MPLAKNQIIPLQITGLSNDGNGVARFDGQVVFVPHVAIDDILQVQIVKTAKKYAFGRIHQLVTPGSGRVVSDCPVSQQCGGCCFRHLSYAQELSAKQTFVQDALQHIGKIDFPPSPILAAPAQNRYRNKVQYPVMADAAGNLQYGFYASRSHRVVPCEDCMLQPELLNHVAKRTASLLQHLAIPPYNEATHTGVIRHIYLRHGVHTGEIMLCLVACKSNIKNINQLVQTITAEISAIKTILLNVNAQKTNVICGPQNKILYGTGYINETISGVPLQLDAFSFSQVNTLGAQQLFQVVRDFAAPTKQDILLDLYCGAGVIGLSMAGQCASLTGVEIVQSAVQSATQSAQKMGFSNQCRFLCEDAATAAARFAAEGYQPTICIVDPPRKGCDENTLRALLTMAPAKIVMVSCNPATMARDLAFLTQTQYAIQKIQPVDMFPRTKHIETVVLLQRR